MNITTQALFLFQSCRLHEAQHQTASPLGIGGRYNLPDILHADLRENPPVQQGSPVCVHHSDRFLHDQRHSIVL